MGGKRVVVSMKASRLKSYLYFKHGTSCVSTSSVGKCASVQRRDHIPPLGHIYIFVMIHTIFPSSFNLTAIYTFKFASR